MKRQIQKFLGCIGLLGVLLFVACEGDDTDVDAYDPTLLYDGTPYVFDLPQGVPQPTIPDDNPMTVAGVELGRHLFYDPIISGDSSMACADCHKQENAFSVTDQFSIGIAGIAGKRNSMPLFNLAFGLNPRFTWGGAAAHLEEQMLEPIINPIELNLSLEEMLLRLENDTAYLDRFSMAFGELPSEELSAKALAQFIRSITSFNSDYDRALRNEPVFPSEQAIAGLNLFEAEFTGDDTECLHCHGGSLFTDNIFHNNGLSFSENLYDFPDLGLGAVLNDSLKNGFFKTPSLRNIAVTGPYMHDGSVQTLEEVLEHYSSGIQFSPNVDPLIRSPYTTGDTLLLNQEEKDALIAFLELLTDETLLTNEQYSNPFE